jgi:hypothetical protein
MIGRLPKELNINGTDRAIRSDFRVALLIFEAFNDPELSDQEKAIVMLDCLYEDLDSIPVEDYQAAHEQAVWFLDGGGSTEDNSKQQAKKVLDWQQDEKIIFSAVNKVAGFETRAVDYMHWWTFLGYFNEIGEGLLTTVINIRQKKNKGKKLEKYEQEFYRENKSLIDIKTRYSEEEQAQKDYLNKLLNGEVKIDG